MVWQAESFLPLVKEPLSEVTMPTREQGNVCTVELHCSCGSIFKVHQAELRAVIAETKIEKAPPPKNK
jgi:hypothetical protein